MDIKFHVNKIIKSGGDVDDWLDFISQLKNIRTDRDLLLQIYTVALKNLKKEATVGYKKLMIGLANLQSEVSSDLARETYLDAKALDFECAVVCVYFAQFEYLHQHKDKARQIIQAAKQNGCAPKYILRQAYQNWRENKLSLLDGINDPWNTLCDHTDDAQTGTQITDTTENKASQGLTIQANKTVTATDLKIKSLLPPTRSINKSKSASNISGNSKWHTPGAKVRKKIADHPDVLHVKSVTNVNNSGVIFGNKSNTAYERHGPGMSPFMQIKYSPLVKRKFNLDRMTDDGIFPPELYLSAEKCPVITPIKNLSRSSGEFGSGNDGSSGSCTSNNMFTNDVLKKSKNSVMKKSISSPCIFQSSRNTLSSDCNLIQDNQLESGSKMHSSTKMDDSKIILNSEARQYATGISHAFESSEQPKINISDNGQKYVLYEKDKNNSKSDGKYNLLIDGVSIDFKNDTPDVNDTVNMVNSIEIHKDLLLTAPGESESENNVYKNMNDLSVENINVEKQKDDIMNTLNSITVNEEPSVNANKIDIFIANEKKKSTRKDSVRIQHDLIRKAGENIKNKTGSEAYATDASSGIKVNLNEDNKRKNADSVGDGLARLGKHEFDPGQVLQPIEMNKKPVSYTVKGMCYHRKKVIGKGGSCKVYEVLSQDGKTFALKKVDLHDVDAFMLGMYKNEIKWLEKMKGNKHIIRLFDWEITGEVLFLVLEKGDCDLAYALKNRKTLPKHDMKEYWRQMITAVKIIHENGIVHTDLKPANFLLVGSMLKLIDFGIANGIQDNKTSVTRDCQMGTLNYMSPEALVQDCCRISRASDVWSLGCILYYMVYKKTPYSDIKNQYSRFFALQQGKPIVYKGIDDQLLLSCLQGCLKHNKKERYSIQQLLVHPYLN